MWKMFFILKSKSKPNLCHIVHSKHNLLWVLEFLLCTWTLRSVTKCPLVIVSDLSCWLLLEVIKLISFPFQMLYQHVTWKALICCKLFILWLWNIDSGKATIYHYPHYSLKIVSFVYEFSMVVVSCSTEAFFNHPFLDQISTVKKCK